MRLILSALCFLSLITATPFVATAEDTSTAPDLKALIHEHTRLQNIMFGEDSSKAKVDKLFALYTPDFIYNHPGQGDIYTRENLYNNSVRFAENGTFSGAFQKKITNIIAGKDAATVEWEWMIVGEQDNTKYMTLVEFKGDKIFMMREYW